MNVARHFPPNKRNRFIDDIEILSGCTRLDIRISTFSASNVNYFIRKADNSMLLHTYATSVDVTVNNTPDGYITEQSIINPLRVYVLRGFEEVKGLRLGIGPTSREYFKIKIAKPLEEFLSRFPNIEHFAFDAYRNLTSGFSDLTADFGKFPISIKKIYLGTLCINNAPTNIILNLNSFTNSSKLEYFNNVGTYNYANSNSKLNVIGDVGNLPSNVKFFSIGAANQMISSTGYYYKKRKVWTSTFDTYNTSGRPFVTTDGLTTKQQNDNILIDMDASIMTATGGKLIALNGTRTTASDAAVASLQSKGFTVAPASPS